MTSTVNIKHVDTLQVFVASIPARDILWVLAMVHPVIVGFTWATIVKMSGYVGASKASGKTFANQVTQVLADTKCQFERR